MERLEKIIQWMQCTSHYKETLHAICQILRRMCVSRRPGGEAECIVELTGSIALLDLVHGHHANVGSRHGSAAVATQDASCGYAATPAILKIFATAMGAAIIDTALATTAAQLRCPLHLRWWVMQLTSTVVISRG